MRTHLIVIAIFLLSALITLLAISFPKIVLWLIGIAILLVFYAMLYRTIKHW